MAVRTLRLQMKKGLAVVKECTEIPLKENVLLHTNEYTFYSNPTTFDKLVRFKSIEDEDEANAKLEEFFTKTCRPVSIVAECFNFDQAVDELKTDLMLGKEEVTKNVQYSDHWEKETNQQVINKFQEMNMGRESMPRIFTSPQNNYKALVDYKNEAIEFIQFDEKFSALKGKNVIVEHINLKSRPMYLIHKLLALVMMIRDINDNRQWGN